MTGTNPAADASLRVSAGAELLDRLSPGWAGKVDPDRLRIASCRDCVLGQLFGDFFDGLDGLGVGVDPERYGFVGGGGDDYGDYDRRDCDALTAGWRRAITERRSAP